MKHQRPDNMVLNIGHRSFCTTGQAANQLKQPDFLYCLPFRLSDPTGADNDISDIAAYYQQPAITAHFAREGHCLQTRQHKRCQLPKKMKCGGSSDQGRAGSILSQMKPDKKYQWDPPQPQSQLSPQPAFMAAIDFIISLEEASEIPIML